MTKRFTTNSLTTPITPFKITDNWLNRELTSIKEVVDAMNDQEEHIRLLQKANENISRASLEISDILENGGVVLTKEQLDEIIREGSYRKKVTVTLQEKKELEEAIDKIDSLIHTQEYYRAWSIIYEKLTGKPLDYRLKM